MPIDEVGSVVVEVVQLAGDAFIDDSGKRRKSRFWRAVQCMAALLLAAFLAFVAYMMLS